MAVNSATVRTGTLGKVVVGSTLISRVKNWSINVVVGESAFGDSDSDGFTIRAAARKDLTGSMVGVFDTGNQIYDLLMPGDIVQLVLWETLTAYWTLTRALIQGFDLTYDIDSKEAVEWTASFGVDGQYYYPGEASAPSHVLP